MIQANELRIGNYVKCDIGPTIVKSIRPTRIFDRDNVSFPLDEIETIPLTEYWLMKFGFERLANGWIIDDGSRNDYGDKIAGDNTFSLFDRSYGKLTDLRYEKIKLSSIHQLQNLYFALTGQELTLKNRL